MGTLLAWIVCCGIIPSDRQLEIRGHSYYRIQWQT